MSWLGSDGAISLRARGDLKSRRNTPICRNPTKTRTSKFGMWPRDGGRSQEIAEGTRQHVCERCHRRPRAGHYTLKRCGTKKNNASEDVVAQPGQHRPSVVTDGY